MLKIGIVGFGYWGTNLVRNFTLQEDAVVYGIAEQRTERHPIIRKNYEKIKIFTSDDDLIKDNNIDALVIATPVFTHYALAKKALLAGKHVMVEKPMTASVVEALELISLANEKKLILMVDHTFLYTGAVQKMKELIESNAIGTPHYFDSIRVNLGLFQPDINVLWDLAPHDISILTYLINYKPYSINATGISHTQNGIENIGYMTINYERDFIAHFNCSWSSPVKVRHTLIGGDKKMILYNDLEPSEKVRVYDSGYNHKAEEERNRIIVDYRTGDVFIPKLSGTEALFSVAKDFVNSIKSNKEPLANGKLGLEVVKILQASQESIKNKGKEVMIK